MRLHFVRSVVRLLSSLAVWKYRSLFARQLTHVSISGLYSSQLSVPIKYLLFHSKLITATVSFLDKEVQNWNANELEEKLKSLLDTDQCGFLGRSESQLG